MFGVKFIDCLWVINLRCAYVTSCRNLLLCRVAKGVCQHAEWKNAFVAISILVVETHL